jgi:hypothetical protein
LTRILKTGSNIQRVSVKFVHRIKGVLGMGLLYFLFDDNGFENKSLRKLKFPPPHGAGCIYVW